MKQLLLLVLGITVLHGWVSGESEISTDYCLNYVSICSACSSGGAVTEQGECPEPETCVEEHSECTVCSTFAFLNEDGECELSVHPRDACSVRDPLCLQCDDNDDFCLTCMDYTGLDMGGTCHACEMERVGETCRSCHSMERVEESTGDIITDWECTEWVESPDPYRCNDPEAVGEACLGCSQDRGCTSCSYNYAYVWTPELWTRCERRCLDPLCVSCSFKERRDGSEYHKCDQCVPGYGRNDNSLNCLPCNQDHCLECRYYDECTRCEEGYYVRRLRSDPANTPSGPWCVACSTEYCATCSESPGTCTQCVSGFALVDNDCIARPCKLSGCRVCNTDQERVCVQCEEGHVLNNGRCVQEELPEETVCADDLCADCHPAHPEVCRQCKPPSMYDPLSRSCYGSRCDEHCEDCYEYWGMCTRCEPGYHLNLDSSIPLPVCYANDSISEVDLIVWKLQRKIENLLEPMYKYLDQVETLRAWGEARNRDVYDRVQDLRTAAKRAGERDLAKQYYQLILADNSVRKTRAGIERVMNTQRRNMGRRRDKLQEKAALLMEWGM